MSILSRSQPSYAPSAARRHGGRRSTRLLATVVLAAATSLGGVAVVAPVPAASAAGIGVASKVFTYQAANAPQTFTVPPFVTDVQVTATGGGGGSGEIFGGDGETFAAGGAGGQVSASLAVTPGETLTVDVGQGGGAADGYTGGAGGQASGDGMSGGAGGAGVTSSANPGGGGGGATEVLDGTQVLLVAGGGGGGGGSGSGYSFNGGNGGQGTPLSNAGGIGNGQQGAGTGGAGGQFNSAFTQEGLIGAAASGPGGAGGGGGGGYFFPDTGYYGGGTGGNAGSNGLGGGGGGGGAGPSYASPTIADPSFSATGSAGDGSVSFSWSPADATSLVSSPSGPVNTGQAVTYTARVNTSGGSPGGTVTFADGGQPISGCVGVSFTDVVANSAAAQCTRAYTQAGSHAITATYNGDGIFPPSTSSTLRQQVTAPATRHVATDGRDSGNTTCSASAPCATLAHALSTARAGDTVALGTGTFTGDATVDIPVTIAGTGPGTVLQGTSGGGTVLTVNAVATVRDLSIHADHNDAIDARTATVQNVSISSAADGVLVQEGTTEVENSTITSSTRGLVSSGSAQLEGIDTTVSGSEEYGVLQEGSSTVALTGSTVSGTTGGDGASGSGYGVVAMGGFVKLTGSTLTGNASGGLRATSATAVITDSTVDGNNGPGLATSGTATLEVGGSILAANRGGDCAAGVSDLEYNLSDDASCGFSAASHDLVNTNPDLGRLAANGGPTETLAPSSVSPALDRIPAGTLGTNGIDEVILCLTNGTDQRGVLLPQPAGGRCDIGAVELAPSTTALAISPATVVSGQALHLTATVKSGLEAPVLPAAAGTVTVTQGGKSLAGCADVPVTAGQAHCTTKLSRGGGPLTAVYHGTNGYRSSSGSAEETVDRAATSTKLVSSLDPAPVDHTVTYTATVTAQAPGSGPVSGTVSFRSGGTTISQCQNVTLSAAGSAKCTTRYGTAGSRLVTAAYAQSVSYKASQATVTEKVEGS